MAEETPLPAAPRILSVEQRAQVVEILTTLASIHVSSHRRVKPLPKHAEVNAYRMIGKAAFDLLEGKKAEPETKSRIIVPTGADDE